MFQYISIYKLTFCPKIAIFFYYLKKKILLHFDVLFKLIENNNHRKKLFRHSSNCGSKV